MIEPAIGICICLILILSILGMTSFRPPPPNQEVILLPGGESLELLVLKGKYSKMHCVCCKWNSDHACNHCTLLSNSQQPSSSFDQGELKCVCLSCFTWCLLQHLGEHKMPRPLVGVCHKCFWWDSHLWWVRFYTCWTPLYVCLRHHPCQGGKTKGNWTQVSIMCFWVFYDSILRFCPVLNVSNRNLVYF